MNKEKAKKITITTLKVLGNVVFALALVLALVVLFMSFGKSSDSGVPSMFGYSPMTVQSESMHPTIKKGDLIFVNQKADDFKEDDIIAYHTIIDGEKAINTHKIVEVKEATETIEERYVTKGDNNPAIDDTEVLKSKVIGRYTGTRIAGLGAVITFVSTTLGFFLVIILPLLAYFIYHVIKVVLAAKEYKKSKETEETVKS